MPYSLWEWASGRYTLRPFITMFSTTFLHYYEDTKKKNKRERLKTITKGEDTDPFFGQKIPTCTRKLISLGSWSICK